MYLLNKPRIIMEITFLSNYIDLLTEITCYLVNS